MASNHRFIGIDVGTGSARAGLFDRTGALLASATEDIKTWIPELDFVEQSSTDIWKAVCRCVYRVLKDAHVAGERVKGIGFDATCSLVLLDELDNPVTVSPTGKDEQNIIVWMDHRAISQAQRINSSNHSVLDYVGGIISPEMESPKLLWLKENLPRSWSRTAHFFDLPDFLTYRATGNDTRSLCTTVCKWTYLGHESSETEGSMGRWDSSFFQSIGLGDFPEQHFRKIGTRVRPMGEPIGTGLTASSAAELGLKAGTAVGVSIIDAHAGGIGMIGADIDEHAPSLEDLEHRIALIGGTSSCHMAVSRKPKYIDGIWGPYYSAMVPGMWLTEGGQSATGSLVDQTVFTHGASAELKERAEKSGISVYEFLNQRLNDLAKAEPFPAALTRELHVCPYFHGNRSPWADPTLRGMISGLRLSSTVDDLALLYQATIQAIACGTRHILEAMNAKGYQIDTILACGGGTRNPLFLTEHADITKCRIVLPKESEAVLLGSAILGAVASREYTTVAEGMAAMSTAGSVIEPHGDAVAHFHDAKYKVFKQLHEDQIMYLGIMGSCGISQLTV